MKFSSIDPFDLNLETEVISLPDNHLGPLSGVRDKKTKKCTLEFSLGKHDMIRSTASVSIQFPLKTRPVVHMTLGQSGSFDDVKKGTAAINGPMQTLTRGGTGF